MLESRYTAEELLDRLSDIKQKFDRMSEQAWNVAETWEKQGNQEYYIKSVQRAKDFMAASGMLKDFISHSYK